MSERDPLRRKKQLAWLGVGLCALSIFLIVPVARAINNFTTRHFGPSFFIYLLLAVVTAAFFGILYVLSFRLKIRRPAQYIGLIVCAALYFYIALVRITIPVKSAHYLEYGLLGILLFRAWRYSIPDRSVYPAALFSGSLVSFCDEIIQWITPGRYWSMMDVGMNVIAVGLSLAAIRKGVRPKPAAEKIASKSVRTVSIILGVNLLLFGLCMSNTPERTAAFAERFPFLAPLIKQEPMREPILKHRDPEIGAFYSRLTVEWLKKTDKDMAVPFAQVLKDWKDKNYTEFLNTYTPLSHPFLHEMRVHLYRRDKRYEAGAKAGNDTAKNGAFFIAYKENLILEKYFQETLLGSGYRWTREKAAEVEALIDKSASYTSPASKDSFYWLSEGTMWMAIMMILILLAAYNAFRAKRDLPSALGDDHEK
jgi:hypothetical protein